MSAFAALMALSASQTKEAQSAVQTALEQRQRNEELKRKKKEEEEKKAREEEAKLRQKRFEDEKKQRELEAKREAEQAKLEAEKARREEEARNSLLYGPKKVKSQGPRWPTSNSGIRDEVRRGRGAGDDDNNLRSGSPPVALTREEKRQKRLEAEFRRTYQVRRSSGAGYSKLGRRLPGGAIDATSAPNSDLASSGQSVKARLAALPNTLTKLNVNKRDTRTIDEILQDRAKAKNATLDGEDARDFNDWFGKSKKKKESSTVPSTQSSATLASPPSSGANSPRPSGTSSVKPQTSTAKASGSKFSLQSKSTSTSTKSSSSSNPKLTSAKPGRSGSPPATKSQPSKSSSSAAAARNGAAAQPKKRPRSPSLSPSPPPSKRRAGSENDAIRSEIWKMFGKDRTSYVARDVFSDDEDMEADADDVMMEELRSTRLARREDEIALLEEKRHDEEKRRRKRERERQGI